MNIIRNYMDLMKKQIPLVSTYIAFVLILVNLMGNASQDKTYTGYEQTMARVVVHNEDEMSEISKGLVKYLELSCNIVETEEILEDELRALQYRSIDGILTIPSGFGSESIGTRKVLLTLETIQNTKASNSIHQIIKDYLNMITLYHALDPAKDESELVQEVMQKDTTSILVTEASKDTDNEESAQLNSYFHLLGFVMFALIFLLVCLTMRSYQQHTMQIRHRVAPVSRRSMNLQLLFGNLIYGYLYAIIFLAIGVLISREHFMTVKLFLYWGNTIIFVTVIVVLAFSVSSHITHRFIILIVSNVVGLILAIVSGVFIRQEYLQPELLKIASLTPMYWFVRANDSIMAMQEYSFSDFVPLLESFGIQLLFAVSCYILHLVHTGMEETE